MKLQTVLFALAPMFLLQGRATVFHGCDDDVEPSNAPNDRSLT